LTVTLAPSIKLYSAATNAACTSTLLISGLDMACRQGLDGAGCYEPGAVTLSGTNSVTFSQPHFNYTCQGARSTQSGSLRLVVEKDIEANTDVTFSFSVKNPMQGQSSPPIHISGVGVYLAPTRVVACAEVVPANACSDAHSSCQFAAGDAAPLKVYEPMFVETQIGQTNPYPCMQNQLQVFGSEM